MRDDQKGEKGASTQLGLCVACLGVKLGSLDDIQSTLPSGLV